MAELPRRSYGRRPASVRSAAQARAYDAGMRDGYQAAMTMLALLAPDDAGREAIMELANAASQEFAAVLRAALGEVPNA
jgi:hypothetical protein